MPNSASCSRREGAPHVVWFYSWQDHPLSDSLADAHRKKMLVGKGAGGLRERERERVPLTVDVTGPWSPGTGSLSHLPLCALEKPPGS